MDLPDTKVSRGFWLGSEETVGNDVNAINEETFSPVS